MEAQERQTTEVEALAGIFSVCSSWLSTTIITDTDLFLFSRFIQEDFVVLPPTYSGQPPQFKLRLVPPPGVAREAYAAIWLIIRYNPHFRTSIRLFKALITDSLKCILSAFLSSR